MIKKIIINKPMFKLKIKYKKKLQFRKKNKQKKVKYLLRSINIVR